MSGRVIFGIGDVPLIMRAERLTCSLTGQSVAIVICLLVERLAIVEDMARRDDAAPSWAGERIAIIDALAELRGER